MSSKTGMDTPATLSGYILVVTEGFFASFARIFTWMFNDLETSSENLGGFKDVLKLSFRPSQ